MIPTQILEKEFCRETARQEKNYYNNERLRVKQRKTSDLGCSLPCTRLTHCTSISNLPSETPFTIFPKTKNVTNKTCTRKFQLNVSTRYFQGTFSTRFA